MRILPLALIGVFSTTQAATIDSSLFYSTDTDDSDVQIIRNAALFRQSDTLQLGPSISFLNYRAPGWSDSSTRVGVAVEYDGPVQVSADVGVMEDTLVGNVDARYKQNDQLTWVGGVERGVLDNEVGFSAKMTSTTVYAGADVDLQVAGAAFVVGNTSFSNDNDKLFFKTKIYTPITDNIHIYTRYTEYSHSQPYNGAYFSPDQYQQLLFGVGATYAVMGGRLRAHIDSGSQRVDGDSSPSYTWRLEYTHRVTDDVTVRAVISEDHNQPEYSYRTGFISINFSM